MSLRGEPFPKLRPTAGSQFVFSHGIHNTKTLTRCPQGSSFRSTWTGEVVEGPRESTARTAEGAHEFELGGPARPDERRAADPLCHDLHRITIESARSGRPDPAALHSRPRLDRESTRDLRGFSFADHVESGRTNRMLGALGIREDFQPTNVERGRGPREGSSRPA